MIKLMPLLRPLLPWALGAGLKRKGNAEMVLSEMWGNV